MFDAAALDMGVSALNFVSELSNETARAAVPGQQFSDEDEGIKAVIELSRMGSRLFILLAVSISIVSIVFAAYVLASSGGDARRLDKGRDIMKQTVIGLFLSVFSYVIVSGVITVYVNVAGSDGAAAGQWSGSLSDDGDLALDDLLDSDAVAHEGEALYFDGLDVVVCGSGVSPDDNRGWDWIDGDQYVPGHCKENLDDSSGVVDNEDADDDNANDDNADDDGMN